MAKLKIKKEQIVLGVIIGAILITAGALTAVILTQTEARIGYTLLETYEYPYVSEHNVTNIDLIINNDEGNIIISYEEDLENPFEAVNRFYGRRNADIADASEFVATENETTASIRFDAPAIYNTSDTRSFYNNLHIKIRSDVTMSYNITTTTGDVYLVFDSFLTQTVISHLNVFSSKGDVSIKFGDNTAVDSSTINTNIQDGSLEIEFDQVEILPPLLVWNMSSDSGSIDFHIDQYFGEENFTDAVNVTYNVETSSGRVTMRYKFQEDLGVQMCAVTSTGTITSDVEIPGPYDPYVNEAFPAIQNYVFCFKAAGTGSIKIKELAF